MGTTDIGKSTELRKGNIATFSAAGAAESERFCMPTH